MNPRYLLALLALIITFSACKETDNEEPLLTNPSLLIKTATQYQDGKVTAASTYEYDDSGRITKISYNAGRYEKYDYVSDTMILVETYNNEFNQFTDTLLLNSKGLVVAKKNITFEYDNEGYLLKSINMSTPVTISNYEVWDGNILGNTYNQMDSIGNPEILFVYTHQYLNASINTIGTENVGKPFYGKQNKNLVSKTHLKRVFSESVLENDFTYSYQFDRYQRVIRQTQENNPVSSYTVYTYND